jgi:hypothetical protein
VKQGVATELVKPEKRTIERKVVQNKTTGEFEVVHIETVIPAVVKQGKAYGSTLRRGKPNVGGTTTQKKATK